MSKQSNQPKTSAKKSQLILCDQFDSKSLTFTELDKNNERSKAQSIAYPRYDYPTGGQGNLIFQTPEVEITQYGLPTIGEYYKTDDMRSFVKIPFDPEQEGCQEMEKMLAEMDKHVSSKKTKEAIFGKYAKLYTYQPIVREPDNDMELVGSEDESDEKEKEKDKKDQKPKFKYCKMKLSVSYPDNELQTVVFLKDGKKREKVTVKSVTDLEKYHNWGCKARYIVMANKLWAAKNKNESGQRKYGITFKIIQMVLTPSERGGSIKESFSEWAFIDSEEGSESGSKSGSEEEQDASGAGSEHESAGEEAAESSDEASDEVDGEGSEEGSEEEAEEEPPKKRRGRKQARA